MDQAEGLAVSHRWSRVSVLTLDLSHNILSLSPYPCHQVDDVKGRGKQ